MGDVAMEGLFSYIFGLKERDFEHLLEEYEREGGDRDPSSLYSYLSLHGKAYAVMWCVLAVVDDISLVAAAVIGPDSSVVWRSVGLGFCRRENAALKSWSRVLEMAAGEYADAPPNISESDYWSASHLARQCADSWQGAIPHLYSEAKSFYGKDFQERKGLLEETHLTSSVGEWLAKWFREMIGKSLPLRAFRVQRVALPQLREAALRVYPLQSALDTYVKAALFPGSASKSPSHGGHQEEEEKKDVVLLPQEDVFSVDLVVDPVNGVPLGELRPGNVVVVKDPETGERVPGEAYMVRQLKNGEYEIHGKDRQKDVFFRYLAPGDVKIKLYSEEGVPFEAPWWKENKYLLFLLGGAVFLFLLLLLFGGV